MPIDADIPAGPLLRRATLQDIPEIMTMMADFHANDRISWRADEARRTTVDLIEHPSYGTFWLVELDGRPIGFLVLTWGFSLEFHGRDAFLDEFYIRPEFRGRGIGSEALEYAAGYCAVNGIRTMHLEVEDSNPRVHRLYERNGFADRGFHLLSKWIPVGGSES